MSLTTRAIIAICLMIGFYVLALSVSAGLLWIVYAQWAYLERGNFRLSLACLIGAGMIIWSILPRWDDFSAPGPQIEPAQHPRLFAVLNEIASATGQEMPTEVFLIPEVNAWVAQRGGIMGIGSNRVMALGLPLMALLNVSQFRAVIAHEFGHFYGGDTRLGPWIYKTRSAIGRTLTGLAQRRSWLVVLFRWYGDLFLRITFAISRAQEYAADRVSANYAGSGALIEGLKQLHRGAVAWSSYMAMEIQPVLASGFSPPLGQGLVRFLQSDQIRTPVEQSLETELREGKSDMHDTHPSLSERIASLKNVHSGTYEDTRGAIELLDDQFAADTTLFLTDDVALSPVSWDRLTQQVWAPAWQKQVKNQSGVFQGLCVRDLARYLTSGELGKKITKNSSGLWPTDDERRQMAPAVAGAALALALLQNGWVFNTLPGECYGVKDDHRVEPFKMTAEIASGKVPESQWQELCESYGIADLPLQPEVARAASS